MRPTRKHALFTAIAAGAVCATTLSPAHADESAGAADLPDGWVPIGSNVETGIARTHVLDNGTIVAAGSSDQSRTTIFVRTPNARKWKREGPGGRCTNRSSVSDGRRVLVVSNCWDKFDSWDRADLWSPGDGWSKHKVPDAGPVWSAQDGRLGFGRSVAMRNGKRVRLPKLPVKPIAMAGANKGVVYALGAVRKRIVITRSKGGARWSKPHLVRRAKDHYQAKQARLVATRSGDVAVVSTTRVLTRKAGKKKWSTTIIRPRGSRSFDESVVVASGKRRFTANWSESGKNADGRRRWWIRSRNIGAAGKAGPIADVDTLRSPGGDAYPWLRADVNHAGDIALGYVAKGKRVDEAALVVREDGDWSEPITMSHDLAKNASVGLNDGGCVVGLADIEEAPEAIAGPNCSVAHPVTDDRTQLPAPTPITGVSKGDVVDVRAAQTQGSTLHAGVTVRMPGYPGRKHLYLTKRKADGTNTDLHRVKDPTGTYKSCWFTALEPAGSSAVARYSCGKQFGKHRSYMASWNPGKGWSKPVTATFSKAYGDLDGKLLVRRSTKRFGLYDPATGKVRSFPAPPVALNVRVGVRLGDDGTVLAFDDSNHYAIYDGKWSKKKRTPLNGSMDYSTDWYYNGGTLVAYDVGAYRIRRDDGTWTPRRKTKGFPDVTVLSDGRVVQVQDESCDGGSRISLREFDRDTGKLRPGATRTSCGRLSYRSLLLGDDGDVLATAHSPLYRYGSAYYLSSADAQWSDAYAMDETAFDTETAPIGDRRFATTVNDVPYLGASGVAVWDFAP